MPQRGADAAEETQVDFQANAGGIAAVGKRERKGKTRTLRLGMLNRDTGSTGTYRPAFALPPTLANSCDAARIRLKIHLGFLRGICSPLRHLRFRF
jgi:hypothetical protein